MKISLFFFVAMMASIGWPERTVAQQVRQPERTPKVSAELWKRTQEKGTVRVIVSLNVPRWTQQAELNQRQVISDTQEKVMAELAGTRHKITGRFYIVAGMVLEVGPDALAVLERSPNVVRVYEDVGISPSPQSIKIEKDPESSK
jgi:uncharacterized Fe-S cluster-containing radical SAM superfamily enzyme